MCLCLLCIGESRTGHCNSWHDGKCIQSVEIGISKEAASEAGLLLLSEEQPSLVILYIHIYIHIVLSSAVSGGFAPSTEVLCKEDFYLFLNPKPSKTTEKIPRVNKKEYSWVLLSFFLHPRMVSTHLYECNVEFVTGRIRRMRKCVLRHIP